MQTLLKYLNRALDALILPFCEGAEHDEDESLAPISR